MHGMNLESIINIIMNVPEVEAPKHTILRRTITFSLNIIINVANGGVLNAFHGLVVDTGLLAFSLAIGGILVFSSCLGHPFNLSLQPSDFSLVNKLTVFVGPEITGTGTMLVGLGSTGTTCDKKY